jgi:hypothetical protein
MAEEKRTYSAETLGLPPLKMVLVHSDREEQAEAPGSGQAPHKSKRQLEKEAAVLRLIEHLNRKP